jgi:Ni,Fe-hydrogenase III small subunit
MLELLRVRRQQGVRTVQFPPEDAGLPERFRGRPSLDQAACTDGCRGCASRAPSAMLLEDAAGRVSVDVGASLFSPEEALACPNGALAYTRDYRIASTDRAGLVSPTGDVELARVLDAKAKALFGRSLRLRSVSAGSCNGCEAELVALGNVVFDLARFGVQFVASPRHADGIVVTGAVSTNMRFALEKTYAAVPEPKLVIAVGACAINGGPFRGSPEVGNGVGDLLPVNLWVPGCPPHPLTMLDGLLRMLGAIEQRAGARPSAG